MKKRKQTINLESQKTISKIIQTMPSFHIKYRIRNSTISATELTFNDKFLQEIGFSIDSFVSQVLQEELPQYYRSYRLNITPT